ncbi:uncharacterized protein LOC131579220 [Poecile atricapillus]|uniref:uncharacterized protein LOC131579220 n=1 Tax=Poecile atricapillus TaxID=48891 RepID=UPI002738A410|nr:uncharacterized protein LOC131579220 [Poecile atricapillus]
MHHPSKESKKTFTSSTQCGPPLPFLLPAHGQGGSFPQRTLWLFPSGCSKDFSPAGCPGIFGQSLQIKVRSPKDINQLRVGQKLELECRADKDSGAFWIHQDKSGNLHTIVFINSMARVTFQGNQKWSSRFEASKHNTIYHLAVKSFIPQDQGNYFCMMNFYHMLYFSPGQPVFLPGQQHLHPASLSPAKMPSTSCPCPFQPAIPSTNPISLLACPRHPVPNPLLLLPEAPCFPPLLLGLPLPKATAAGEPTTQWGITEKDLFLKTPDPAPAGPFLFSIPAGSRMQEDLNYFCLVFIWVPLAGLCLLLLQLVAITRMVMCRRKVHHDPL